jgi:hypothetical protein
MTAGKKALSLANEFLGALIVNYGWYWFVMVNNNRLCEIILTVKGQKITFPGHVRLR